MIGRARGRASRRRWMTPSPRSWRATSGSCPRDGAAGPGGPRCGPPPREVEPTLRTVNASARDPAPPRLAREPPRRAPRARGHRRAAARASPRRASSSSMSTARRPSPGGRRPARARAGRLRRRARRRHRASGSRRSSTRLAARIVSPASARRPDHGLAGRLGRRRRRRRGPAAARPPRRSTSRRTHARADLGRVVILDLPDVDSLEAGHRAAVEALLPKLDVVAWVTDPEKYADAVAPRRLPADLDAAAGPPDRGPQQGRSAGAPRRGRTVERDLQRVLPRAHEAARGDRDHAPRRARPGSARCAAWLADAAEAKAVVAARADGRGARGARGARERGRASAARTARWPARAGGRTSAGRSTAPWRTSLRVVDLPGAERQAVAATRARARRRGTGPIGILTSAIYRFSGRQRQAADPAEYLRGWRGRGGLTRAAELDPARDRRCPAGRPAAAAVALRRCGRGAATWSAASATALDRVDRPPFGRSRRRRAGSGRSSGCSRSANTRPAHRRGRVDRAVGHRPPRGRRATTCRPRSRAGADGAAVRSGSPPATCWRGLLSLHAGCLGRRWARGSDRRGAAGRRRGRRDGGLRAAGARRGRSGAARDSLAARLPVNMGLDSRTVDCTVGR